MPFLFLGSVFGFLSVAFGAFGAHALKDRLVPADLEIFKTAVLYQMVHALALVAVGLWLRSQPSASVERAGWAFVVGTVVFCGSLYFLVLTGPRALGAITPIGGVSFLLGWAFLAYASLRA